jgi:hypothetical protein
VVVDNNVPQLFKKTRKKYSKIIYFMISSGYKLSIEQLASQLKNLNLLKDSYDKILKEKMMDQSMDSCIGKNINIINNFKICINEHVVTGSKKRACYSYSSVM